MNWPLPTATGTNIQIPTSVSGCSTIRPVRSRSRFRRSLRGSRLAMTHGSHLRFLFPLHTLQSLLPAPPHVPNCVNDVQAFCSAGGLRPQVAGAHTIHVIRIRGGADARGKSH